MRSGRSHLVRRLDETRCSYRGHAPSKGAVSRTVVPSSTNGRPQVPLGATIRSRATCRQLTDATHLELINEGAAARADVTIAVLDHHDDYLDRCQRRWGPAGGRRRGMISRSMLSMRPTRWSSKLGGLGAESDVERARTAGRVHARCPFVSAEPSRCAAARHGSGAGDRCATALRRRSLAWRARCA